MVENYTHDGYHTSFESSYQVQKLLELIHVYIVCIMYIHHIQVSNECSYIHYW